MASSGKKKTTMAKLSRESRLRERRVEKKARKDRRQRAAEDNPGALGDTMVDGEPTADGEAPIGDNRQPPVRNMDPVTGRAA